ncbi:MAG: diguanylate cyclase [Bradymonadales bacterium]|nr:MAG: diguanylate cyclase [Bradymonadales bacterium]
MKILIIDDNAHHAELAANRLKQEGWAVDHIDRVENLSNPDDYNFVLLDYHMPVKNGIEVLRLLKEKSVKAPVIFMTGHGNEVIASEAMKLGAYDYVVKDTKLVYLDRLPSVIREAESKHKLLETNQFLIHELRKANDRLQRLTFTDEMTGAYNYRFLKSQLDTEIKRAERYSKPLSVCIIDVDFFKQINDEFGHPGGDATLKKVAKILNETVRTVDFVGRYAGDEFLIIFPDTELQDAMSLCERIRQAVVSEPITFENGEVCVSLSIGVSDFHPTRRETADRLVAAADRALYLAKKAGRNRVESVVRPVSSKREKPVANLQLSS